MKKLIDLLKEHQGNFISGREIGNNLNISRSAVNKQIQKLREKGYKINSKTNKGYCLTENDNTLDIEYIKNKLNHNHTLEYFDCIDSTNTYLKENIKNLPFGHIVLANEQYKGRGRLNRSFLSTKDKGVYLSILIEPNCSIEESLKLTILTSVAVFSAIKKNYNIEIKLKWVNDLIYNNLKIGGILCEGEVELNSQKLNNMIIGIGINVKEMSFPKELKDIATSIENHSNIKISRNDLISDIINFFDLYFFKEKDYMKIYKDNFLLQNTEIIVYQNNTKYNAIAIGIDESGALVVKKDNEIIKLNSGEITVRKQGFRNS